MYLTRFLFSFASSDFLLHNYSFSGIFIINMLSCRVFTYVYFSNVLFVMSSATGLCYSFIFLTIVVSLYSALTIYRAFLLSKLSTTHLLKLRGAVNADILMMTAGDQVG